MAKKTINLGVVPDGDGGDNLRSAFTKTNENFSELYRDKVNAEAGKQLSDENYTLAEKDKLSGVAVEATKNRADSENADKVHTHVIGDVTGLSTRLSDIGELSQLTTAAKSNLVAAINEAATSGGGGSGGGVSIDDAAGLGNTNVTWSADKSSRELEDKVDKVTGKGLSDTNFTQTEKTKLGGIATEATKNRADSENADKLHSHTTAQITGLDSALAGKADKTTQVIAGTGLTGGGTLADNRTLTVLYGTAAGTAAQGNDSRITGALQTSQVAQVTGTSTTNVMSQKATTDAIANIPSVPKTAAYTVAAADKGKSIDTTANVTIPASVFAVGDVIVVTNTSASDISITPASGVTFRLAGSDSTGVRTLSGYGVATLRMVSNNVWFASGAGLS